MEYVVTSKSLYGKKPGEKITEKELLAVGANIQKHLQSGRLTKSVNVPKVQEVKQEAVKQEQQAPKVEPEVFVFNKYNNEGDK
jgi:hypothetical protein